MGAEKKKVDKRRDNKETEEWMGGGRVGEKRSKRGGLVEGDQGKGCQEARGTGE